MKWDKIADLNGPIVSMINYKDMVLVATPYQVYVLKDGKVSPLEFEMQEMPRTRDPLDIISGIRR